jgi:hypothetical protein
MPFLQPFSDAPSRVQGIRFSNVVFSYPEPLIDATLADALWPVPV